MPGFAGFDCYDYPGLNAMQWLKANTNLSWCGYYLGPAPSHSGTSWMNTRTVLRASGWGIAPIFVGQQITGPGSHDPSAATGMADGRLAAKLMSREGFEGGSFVYLDLENGPPLPDHLEAYTANWCDAVAANGFQPGIYCSHLLALQLHNLRPNCRVWAFHVATTGPHPVPNPFPDPNPSGCGYVGAYAWQLGQRCQITLPAVGAGRLTVDLNSAITPAPGAP